MKIKVVITHTHMGAEEAKLQNQLNRFANRENPNFFNTQYSK